MTDSSQPSTPSGVADPSLTPGTAPRSARPLTAPRIYLAWAVILNALTGIVGLVLLIAGFNRTDWQGIPYTDGVMVAIGTALLVVALLSMTALLCTGALLAERRRTQRPAAPTRLP